MAEKFLLHDIDPDEVSLVGKGANRRRLIWKSADTPIQRGELREETMMETRTGTMFDRIAQRRDALVADGVSKDEATRRAAWKEIETLASAAVEKSDFALSREAAIEQVCDRHKELVALYSGDYEVADTAEIEKAKGGVKPPRDASQVFAEIEKLARNLVEKSGYALSLPQALDRVVEARPDLLDEYRAARDAICQR